MDITKELLEYRLEVLDKQRRDLQATFYALEGAQEDCRFWLAKLADLPPPQQE